tara:strand:- start:22268 stop:23041 length:774 start_codon:yes stop_codon:yes gene_type:complete
MAAFMSTSAGSDVDINLAVGQMIFADIGPFVSASGTAPPSYDESQTLVNVGADAEVSGLGLLTTGLDVSAGATTAAAEGAAAGSGTMATGSSEIAGLNFSFSQSLAGTIGTTLLSFDADAITSTSSASAGGVSGSSFIENASLGGTLLDTLSIDLGLFTAAGPNTVLLDLLGISIILNEQIETGDGVNTLGIETNAVHVSLSDFLLGTQLLTGDIYIGRSSAFVELGDEVAEVPAPAAIGLLGLGLAGLAFARRRRA